MIRSRRHGFRARVLEPGHEVRSGLVLNLAWRPAMELRPSRLLHQRPIQISVDLSEALAAVGLHLKPRTGCPYLKQLGVRQGQ